MMCLEPTRAAVAMQFTLFPLFLRSSIIEFTSPGSIWYARNDWFTLFFR